MRLRNRGLPEGGRAMDEGAKDYYETPGASRASGKGRWLTPATPQAQDRQKAWNRPNPSRVDPMSLLCPRRSTCIWNRKAADVTKLRRSPSLASWVCRTRGATMPTDRNLTA